jgi:hypothetical protein
MDVTPTTESKVAGALRSQIPVRAIPGVSITNVEQNLEQPFDVSFDLLSGPNQIRVLGEVKTSFSPRILEEIGPWIRRLKLLRPDVAVAVIAPQLSAQSQAFCIENGIDFLDMAGNIFINVPGKFTLQRSGMRASGELIATSPSERTVNVFSGRFSRVLRVLLQQPRSWSVSEIARELENESAQFRKRFPGTEVDFTISQGSVSKAIAGLEEQLGVRRRGTAIVVPEPARLLQQWAEKYKERYRWRLRSSFTTANPFGKDLEAITNRITPMMPGAYAFTGAIAAMTDAPFVDIDTVDVFVLGGETSTLRDLKSRALMDATFRVGGDIGYGSSSGSGAGFADGSGYGSGIQPKLRFITPYDAGVFMYEKQVGPAPVVSPVQSYLDLYARGGRDSKQAEYLLDNVLQPQWGRA